MNKLLGYGLMVLGIVVIAVNFFMASLSTKISFLAKINPAYVLLVGVALVVAGFLFSFNLYSSSKKGKQISEEVPIYHGDHIVGYRKANK